MAPSLIRTTIILSCVLTAKWSPCHAMCRAPLTSLHPASLVRSKLPNASMEISLFLPATVHTLSSDSPSAARRLREEEVFQQMSRISLHRAFRQKRVIRAWMGGRRDSG